METSPKGIFALLVGLLLASCSILQIVEDPLSQPLGSGEGAVFVSVTHIGGLVDNWVLMDVEEIYDGRALREYTLRSQRPLRSNSHTALFSGVLKQGRYRIKSLRYFAGEKEVHFNLGRRLDAHLFLVKSNQVNDLGRLIVAGPIGDGVHLGEGLAIELSRNFMSNKSYIEQYSPGYLQGKTVSSSAWIGAETSYQLSDFGRIIAHGYEAVVADAAGNIYAGNRMGAVLKIGLLSDKNAARVAVFNSGEIDTIRALLLSGDDIIVGGDMPSIPVINRSSKAISHISRSGLQNGSIEYFHEGNGADLYAVICSRAQISVQHCPDKKQCEWQTLRSFTRAKFLGEHADRDICGGTAWQKQIMVYYKDERDRSQLVFYDPGTEKWNFAMVPLQADSIHVNYGTRIVAHKNAGFASGAISVSDDAGRTWRAINYPDVLDQHTPPVFLNENEGYLTVNNTSLGDAAASSRVFKLMKTVNGGTTWTTLNERIPDGIVLFTLPNADGLYGKTVGNGRRSMLVKVEKDGELIQLINNKPKISEVNGAPQAQL